MGRIGLIIFIALIPLSSAGQKTPLSNQYIHDALYINPAYAGAHNALSTTILFRNQWVGLDDSPRNHILSVHSPLFNDRVGLGVFVDHSSIGIFDETSFMTNYAFRLEVNKGVLALGLGLGITIQNVAWLDLIARDPNDNLLSYENTSSLRPEFSVGAFYYNKRFFMGFSIPYFISHEYDKESGKYLPKNVFSEYNYMLMTGYNLSLGKALNISPSVLVRYHGGSSIQVDYNLLLTLKDRVSMGGGYRSGGCVIGMLVYQANNQLKLAYSYNFDMGILSEFLPSSHEITLNYALKYSRNVSSPR